MIAQIFFLSQTSRADIADSFRRDNAVVLYEFDETSGDVLDSGNAKFGAPLNLRIFFPNSVLRGGGALQINEPNLIRSINPADKITNECKKQNAVTIEAWIENNESVEKRAGFEGSQRNSRSQPLRIVSLSKDMLTRNFLLGQFYTMGNHYSSAVNTSGNENETNNRGNSLRDPLVSKTSAIIIPDPKSPAGTSKMQKVIVTVGSSGVARLYLSDRNGVMYLAETKTTGFNGNFSSWRLGSYLTLGNEMMADSEIASQFAKNPLFQGCNSDECFTNPNRYWKGRLHRLAIYCQEVSRENISGTAFQVVTNPLFDIDLSTSATPLRLRAQEIHQRLTGVKTPLVNPVLGQMELLLNANDQVGAAALATDDANFYNITVRDFAARMSNREETINTPLNDFTATIIGAVRDNLSAQKLLTDNIVYKADPTKAAVPSDWADDILRSNNHYEALGTGHFDLKAVLVSSPQKLFDGGKVVDNPTPAGLLTTRQWMAAHAIAGTNRRPVEYSFRQFLCTPMEKAADSSGPDNVIGRDIDRFPGGSHAKFSTTCKSCHTIMDGFRGAFSRFTFSNGFVKHAFLVPAIPMSEMEDMSMGMQQDPPFVAVKLNHNSDVFPGGRVITDDSWVNNANRGTNAGTFAWTKESGKGIREFGQLISESKQFSICMAQRVFRSVCKRDVASIDSTMIQKVAEEFSSTRQYNLRFLFQKIVTTPECLGEGK